MSWDRVIQDSDDEDAEILIEDDFPTSTDPLQGQNYSPTQENQDQADYPIEPTLNASQQLSVNFDQFLQSQEGIEQATASQQQLEARWISTVEGGAESIGPMMKEIGMAQQKLLQSDSSSANFPSTTPYPSEISQPGSFPTMQNYQIQPTDLLASPYRAGADTQLTEPFHVHHGISAMSNIATTSEQMTTMSTHVTLNTGISSKQKPLQHLGAFTPAVFSPHDTEPSSSFVSPKRSKSDTVMSGIIRQQSPCSPHDELSMPVVNVEVSSVKKGRGRPRNRVVPQDDDDDELAMTMAPAEPSTVVPLSPKKKALEILPKPDKEQKARKATKQKKAKRSKTSVVLEKSQDEDDVIWVESKPLEEIKNNTDAESKNRILILPVTVPSLPTETKPPPKKRGRKRKKTSNETEKEPEQTQAPEIPAALQASTSENIMSNQETEPSQIQTPQQEPSALTKSSEPPPQMPLKASSNEPVTATPNKGPLKNSPMMSTGKVPYRVGLSRNARIAPLLKMVRK